MTQETRKTAYKTQNQTHKSSNISKIQEHTGHTAQIPSLTDSDCFPSGILVVVVILHLINEASGAHRLFQLCQKSLEMKAIR
jgi:hypothetical protein